MSHLRGRAHAVQPGSDMQGWMRSLGHAPIMMLACHTVLASASSVDWAALLVRSWDGVLWLGVSRHPNNKEVPRRALRAEEHHAGSAVAAPSGNNTQQLDD